MDCILCYKVFIKDKEFVNFNPDPQLCKKTIAKLFEISKNPDVQGLSEDLVACLGCHLKMEDVGGLMDQLEELQRRVNEAKIEILNEMTNSKEKNLTMAERTGANRMSPSSQDRLTLLKAIEAKTSTQAAPEEMSQGGSDNDHIEEVTVEEIQSNPNQTSSARAQIGMEIAIEAADSPPDQVPMDKAEEDGNGLEPIGENPIGGIEVQNQPPETCSQIGVGIGPLIRSPAPDHDGIDSGNSESFHEEEDQTTECPESEDSNDYSNEEQVGVVPAGATILQLKEVKICLKRVELPPGVSKIKLEDKSNPVSCNSKGGYALRNSKPAPKGTIQVEEPSNEEPGSGSEAGESSSSEGDTEGQNKARVGSNGPGLGTSANARCPSAPRFALEKFIRLENGSFECKHCSRIFKHLKNLREHLLIHAPRRFKCSILNCGKRFTRKTQRNRHVKTVHEKKKVFKCTWPGCGKGFGQKSGLIRHVETVHEGKREFCNWVGCGKSFTQRSNLNTHIKTIHEGRKYFKCRIEGCGKAFGSKHVLVRHKQIKHKKIGVAKKKRVGVARVISPQPGSSSQPNNLNRPAKVGHDEAMDFKCGLCDKAFARNTNLRRHVSAKHKKIGVAEKKKVEVTPRSISPQADAMPNIKVEIFECRIGSCRNVYKMEDVRDAHEKAHKTINFF